MAKPGKWLDKSSAYALTPIRLIVGVVGVVHGWPKVADLGPFIDGVGSMGIPLPQVFATAAAFSEFLGGILLILGLFTRQAAFFFGCVMAVAVFKVHWSGGFMASNNGFEYPLVLLLACVSLIFGGSGPLSVDRLRGRHK